MIIKSFKDILAWQYARELTTQIYKQFSNCKDYSFRDQIQRAAVSVMNNIAEGYGRRSDRSFKNFLLIAKGSAAEVESMLIISVDLGYLSEDNQKILLDKTEEVSRLLSGFVKKLSTLDS